GDGTTTSRSTPVYVLSSPGGAPISGVADLSAGGAHACARKMDGSLLCWGSNFSGEIVDGTTSNRVTPVWVPVTIAGMSLSYGFSCATTTTGDLLCWGANTYGQLGNGSMQSSSSPMTVALGTNTLANATITGDEHACALTNSGTVECWGNND